MNALVRTVAIAAALAAAIAVILTVGPWLVDQL